MRRKNERQRWKQKRQPCPLIFFLFFFNVLLYLLRSSLDISKTRKQVTFFYYHKKRSYLDFVFFWYNNRYCYRDNLSAANYKSNSNTDSATQIPYHASKVQINLVITQLVMYYGKHVSAGERKGKQALTAEKSRGKSRSIC